MRSWFLAVLAIEFLLLFFIGPTLLAYTRHRMPPIPALWGVLAYCLILLLHDPKFDRSRLWSIAGFSQDAPAILSIFAIALMIGIILVWRYTPQTFLSFPKANPVLWREVMVLYPVLSVYPQGIVFRAFIFDRYHYLFGPGWGIVLASAAAFAYVHIVFRNSLAIALTFLGGLLFAFRYWQTGSLMITSFEHALYGCAIFTIGLGRWFYHGAISR